MTSTIKILHVIGSSENGGGERYIYDLIKYSNEQFSHKVVLPYCGPLEKLLINAKFDYLVIDLQKKFSIKSLYRLKKTIKQNNIKIIHSHGYRANFYARLAGMFSGTKNIATMHVSLFDYVDTPAVLKKLYIFVEKILAFKTAKFICISKAMQSDVLRLGVPKNKIALIPNGIDLKRFKQKQADRIKLEFGLNGFGPIIGTVGRMVTEKGQKYLVEALGKLIGDWPHIKCLFIGDGPKLRFLKYLARKFKVEDICLFPGIRIDIEKIYPAMNLFVLPSLREPFGLSLLEAMACRIPVISTETGGPKDFIKSGHNGLLVPAKSADALAEGIKFLLANENKAKTIAINGQNTVIENYNIETMVQKTEQQYISII